MKRNNNSLINQTEDTIQNLIIINISRTNLRT